MYCAECGAYSGASEWCSNECCHEFYKLPEGSKMALKWVQVTAFRASSPDGSVYTISENPHLTKGNRKFVAVRSIVLNGRMWEHIVGYFDEVEEAKTSCWNDSKDE